VVVGAQAVYLRTGVAGLTVAPFTTDGDVALDPTLLGDDPLSESSRAAKRTHGLEVNLVDNDLMPLAGLASGDGRRVEVPSSAPPRFWSPRSTNWSTG